MNLQMKTLDRLFALVGWPFTGGRPETEMIEDCVIQEASGDSLTDQESISISMLEDQLERNGLVLGIKKEKRKVVIDIFPDTEEPLDFQPITARMALGYKQGAWLRKYFRLDALAGDHEALVLQ